MSLTEEELEKNWNKTLELMSKLGESSTAHSQEVYWIIHCVFLEMH
jgi:hypothetical protein